MSSNLFFSVGTSASWMRDQARFRYHAATVTAGAKGLSRLGVSRSHGLSGELMVSDGIR